MSTEAEYLSLFEQRELGPDSFDHRGHLYMAWLHLTHFDFDEANERVCSGIRDLAAKFNAPEKFNYTLTEALMRIMAKRLNEEYKIGFEQYLQDNHDLIDDAEDLLAQHYSHALLYSDKARNEWVEPDKEPLN